MIWFTSDTHFNHKKICMIEGRPFTSLEEMNEAIIANWNQYVAPTDIVYHVGDFAFRHTRQFVERLHGKLHLITGNHDQDTVKHAHSFASYQASLFLTLDKNTPEEQKIHLYHFKCTVWWCCHYGAWNIFGHSHGSLPDVWTPGKCLDVGIMQKKWAPNVPWLFSYPELREYMRDKPLLKNTGHHGVITDA